MGQRIAIEKKRDGQESGLDDPKKLWDYLRQELTDTNESMSFDSFSRKEIPAVLELQRRGFVGICRLKIKIEEKNRDKEYEI